MANTPTPHNSALVGEIAKTVLMPGDPLRAEFISRNYLKNSLQFNNIRGMLGFTGEFEGQKVSVMGSGMGMPSMGIYSYELFAFYEVENIIRIGTAAGIHSDLKLRDIVIAAGACTDSAYANQYKLPGNFSAIASFNLLCTAVEVAKEQRIKYMVGNVFSTDVFYTDTATDIKDFAKLGVLAVEMESAALYMNAARLRKNAVTICTISDLLTTGEATTAQERQDSFTDMMEVALKTAVRL